MAISIIVVILIWLCKASYRRNQHIYLFFITVSLTLLGAPVNFKCDVYLQKSDLNYAILLSTIFQLSLFVRKTALTPLHEAIAYMMCLGYHL